jgi:uncharacterized protein with FMN-binding domain
LAVGKQTVKKLVASVVIVGSFVVYSLIHGRSNPAAALALVPHTATATFPATDTPAATAPAGATAATSPTATPGALYKDGTYTGSVADAQWGYVQVQAIIQGGKITDVKWLEYPADRSTSRYINSIADPQLTSEAIQAQSAQVDLITGATDSSYAFIQSLTDALSQAHT